LGPEETWPDEALLAQFLRGDSGAFEELVRRHEDRVFALAYRMTGDRQDALDATQDAFIMAFRRAHSFRGESSFGTWIYRIAINASLDVIRKRRRAPRPVEDVLTDDRGAPNSALEDSVVATIDVSRALRRLPHDYREAVALHDLAGVPYEEIARMTGVSLGTVKSRISRGRHKLAELLEHSRPQLPSKGAT
jgi:RNA polymerase sigma-70 factor, ECF subfamily